MDQVQQWVWRNQWIIPLVVWLITAIITEIFKPRTQAQYDAMNPRIAALLVSLGSVSNVSKLLEYAKRVFTGWAAPPSALLVLCALPFLHGCGSARANPVDFGITPRSVEHAKAIDKCLSDAAINVAAKVPTVCAIYNQCQRDVATKYNAPIEGRCVETTAPAAASAGVPAAALPFIGGAHVAAR